MLAWYLALARRRPLVAILLLLALAVGTSAVARVVLGDRGALVPTLLYLLFGLALASFLGVRFTRAAFDRVRGSRLVLILAIPLDAFALFVLWQVAMVTADLLLPLETRDVDVGAWRYQPSGRGPGALHLLLVDGEDREMPAFAFYGGPQTPGRYRIELTGMEGLVISAVPVR